MTVILKIRFYICPCLRMKKNKTMKKNCFLLLFLLCACLVQAQDTYRTDKDVPYISGSETDAYRLERCKLDVYYPENKKDFSDYPFMHLLYSQLLVCQRVCLQNTVCLICK